MSASILVVDNYDSFTYNLVQYLGEAGAQPVVWRADKFTLNDVEELAPDGIVISPGPCTPTEAGLSVELIRAFGPRVPTLGVCLGHQCIGEAFGAKVVRAPLLMHGKTSRVTHDASGLLAELPSPFTATRYHSLIVRDPPQDLIVNAWVQEAGERIIMGLRHRLYPIHGVQFHPESILTEGGQRIIEAFLKLTAQPRPAGVP